MVMVYLGEAAAASLKRSGLENVLHSHTKLTEQDKSLVL
jgi:hypothetical protein